MIKILYNPIDESNVMFTRSKPRVIYGVQDSDESLILSFQFNYYGNDVQDSYVFNKEESKGRVFQGRFIRLNTNGEFVVTEGYKFITQSKFMLNSSKTDSVLELFRVVFEPEGGVILYLQQESESIEEFECYPLDLTEGPATYHLCKYSSWFSSYFNELRKKGEFIREVDIYKTVSYLEAQIDLLTRLCLRYLPQDELTQYLKQADSYSVLNNKPLEDVAKEFTESKRNFRELQEKYYGRLHG